MTASFLKLIAVVTMLIDHSAYLIYAPGYEYLYYTMRIIGRVSFPIFVFCISESLYFTRNKTKFLLRMLIFALISEISFNLYFNYLIGVGVVFSSHNGFFTFAIGIALVIFFEEILEFKKKWIGIILIIAVILLCYFIPNVYNFILNCDYGLKGIIFLFILYLEKKYFLNKAKRIRQITLAIMLFILYGFSILFLGGMVSLLIIEKYTGEKGKEHKFFFYWFYPLHLLILSAIHVMY